MTISSEVRKAGPYAGNDVATAFPFSFKVFSADDMLVVLTDQYGVETTLVGGGTDYSVALNADQDTAPGGAVNTVTALATGTLLTLTSCVPNLQPIDITNQGGFYPKIINAALDRLTILAQQNAEQIRRSVKVPISSSVSSDDLIAQLTEDAATAAAAVAITSASEDAAAASQSAAAGSASAAAASQSAAAGSASAAAASKSAAATSATNAGNSATAASSSATTASTQATNASNSATAASVSATNAANSAAAAAASYDSFDDRYLGAKSANPTTDNDGNALLVGALYWNSASGQMRSWDGAFWQAAYTSIHNIGSLSFRNKIINGDMRVYQRGYAVFATPSMGPLYGVDRFYIKSTGDSGAMTRLERAAGPVANTYRSRVYWLSINPPTRADFGTRLEAEDTAMLAGTTATLSLLLSSPALTSITWTASYANAKDDFSGVTQIATGTFPITSTEARYSTTISIPAAATTGIQIQLSALSPGTQNEFIVGEMQLEPGSTVTPFERRPYAVELALCQRYYYKIGTTVADQMVSLGSVSTTTTQVYGAIYAKVPLRIRPTALEQSGTAADYSVGGTNCSSVPTFETATTDAFCVRFYLGSALTAGNAVQMRLKTTAGFLAWSAEL